MGSKSKGMFSLSAGHVLPLLVFILAAQNVDVADGSLWTRIATV